MRGKTPARFVDRRQRCDAAAETIRLRRVVPFQPLVQGVEVGGESGVVELQVQVFAEVVLIDGGVEEQVVVDKEIMRVARAKVTPQALREPTVKMP
ncbi:MAG: hypothetical protein OXU62_06485 [Gammaproteobacteria bacterium]|nr:hypothetical protein [Gammaproteobacteria bacterium]